MLKWDGALVGFCAVLTHPSGTMNTTKRIHRLVILPDYQGLGIGTKFLETMCELYVSRGFKVCIRTAHNKLGHHMDKSSLWRSTGRNCKTGAISTGKINGKNQNMYIVNSTRYSYEYMGPEWATKPHYELVVDSLKNIDLDELRKMLIELKATHYVTVVHSSVKVLTELNAICRELSIRSELLYRREHGAEKISNKHKGKRMLVSLKFGKRPVYRKVA